MIYTIIDKKCEPSTKKCKLSTKKYQSHRPMIYTISDKKMQVIYQKILKSSTDDLHFHRQKNASHQPKNSNHQRKNASYLLKNIKVIDR